VYARQIEDRTLSFGVSGMLLRDSLVMYDRETQSLWTQVDGIGIRGALDGHTLQAVPSLHTTWKAWKALYPESRVLRKRTRRGSPYDSYNRNPNELGILGRRNVDPRLDGKTRILGVRQGGVVTAFPIDEIREVRLVTTTVGDLPVLLAAASVDTPVQVYDRRLDGSVLTFGFTDGGRALRDNETATTWRLSDGVAIDGPLQGRRLTRVAGHSAFWFGWQGFFPRSTVWHADQ
jgi:hypothetical protein|tara:strand:- start:188 stop:886 length:699 start_codon:yes stop_codon:yes gene_type:complete